MRGCMHILYACKLAAFACLCVLFGRHLTMQCSEVPHWMFIDWISQMLPLMDKQVGEAVEGILYSISVDYPQVEIHTTATLDS